MADLEAMRLRLEAAERVCVLFGWCGIRQETDRDKAVHEAWRDWIALPGTSADPEDHPELDDAEIARLARVHDERRAEHLRKLSKLIEVVPGG